MPPTVDVREYLKESNAIEGVHDDAALADALDAWQYLSSEDALSRDVIQRGHELLLENRQPDIAGEYRSVRVQVGNDVPPHPEVVDELVSTLLDQPVETGVDAVQWHVWFEKIHPFADGNGRIGRLLYLWHCLETLDVEPIVWRSGRDVSGYYALFQSEPDPRHLIEDESSTR